MKKFLLLSCVFLAACTAAPAENDGQAASSAVSVSASSVTQSSGAEWEHPSVLDRTYASEKLGISFRYPSSFVDTNCPEPLSVSVREYDDRIEFIWSPLRNGDCKITTEGAGDGNYSPTIPIFAKRVKTEKELQAFIGTVFPYDCEITEQEDYEGMTTFWLRSKHPPADEPDFRCGEVMRWNRTANVAYFSPLESKTGGGPDWPTSVPFVRPDTGEQEWWYDGVIMASLQFLPE